VDSPYHLLTASGCFSETFDFFLEVISCERVGGIILQVKGSIKSGKEYAQTIT